MISHKFFNTVLEMGSLKVYYLWESPHESVPITQNYYWHDKKCEKSIGPFASLAEAMTDYAAAKRTEKALQRQTVVKELLKPRHYSEIHHEMQRNAKALLERGPKK
jgi:hypothetical protein